MIICQFLCTLEITAEQYLHYAEIIKYTSGK